MEQVATEIKTLEKELGKKFGDDKQPAAGIGAQRCGGFHAGHDEHDFESRD